MIFKQLGTKNESRKEEEEKGSIVKTIELLEFSLDGFDELGGRIARSGPHCWEGTGVDMLLE